MQTIQGCVAVCVAKAHVVQIQEKVAKEGWSVLPSDTMTVVALPEKCAALLSKALLRLSPHLQSPVPRASYAPGVTGLGLTPSLCSL